MPFNPKRAWKRLQLRVWRRPEDDRDLADEVAFHLAEEERLRVEAGMRADEARASARRDFGNVPRVMEITRSMRGLTALESVVQDLRFALRLLRRNRVFALFAIASLALGIGATTAIFSLFDAIVLRELPVREPGRLVTLSFAMSSNRPNNSMTYPHFARMRDENQTLDGLFAWTRVPRTSVGFQGRRRRRVEPSRQRRVLLDAGAKAGARAPAHSRRRPRGVGCGGPQPRLLAAAFWRQPGRRRQHLCESSALHHRRRRAQGVCRRECRLVVGRHHPAARPRAFRWRQRHLERRLRDLDRDYGTGARGRHDRARDGRLEADLRAGQRVGRAGRTRATRLPPASRAKPT